MPERAPRAFKADARRAVAVSAGKAVWWAANGLLARRLTKGGSRDGEVEFRSDTKAPPPLYVRKLWLEAFRKDAEDIAQGLYPPTEGPPRDLNALVRTSLDFLADARRVAARRRRGEGFEVRSHPSAAAYPPYYRQNFHYQSGGWLTPDSARRYEAQVEALFSGAAGPMRRRALSLLARALKDRDQRNLKILDIACGSGSFLVDLKAAFPRAGVAGLDYSAPYLAEAGRRSAAPRILGAAERLPIRDESLDAATSIFLLHELPPKVRKAVAAEVARTLKPGGLFALADSVQAEDAPEAARLLEAFPVFFHEPYYESYQSTNLVELFETAGLKRIGSDSAFLTKALLFEKPA